MAENHLFNQRFLTEIKSQLNTGRFRHNDFALVGRNDGITLRYRYKTDYNMVITLVGGDDQSASSELSFNLSYSPGMVLQVESRQRIDVDALSEAIGIWCQRIWENLTADRSIRHLNRKQMDDLRQIELKIRELDPDEAFSAEQKSDIENWLEIERTTVREVAEKQPGTDEIAQEIITDIETLETTLEVFDRATWWEMAFVRIRNWAAAPSVPPELLEAFDRILPLVESR